ncbi:alginate lyase family protein [Asticcacaulis sp. SL142]|uniref:alginate lyase family protein n=1 Tax=Asticcacaulis sp. SL142 TaxID=2995155 RepID=UPI00226C71FC|nr:alginate lyase family protein [Asticcacaulis sp. SL142]WAC48296.1 alginate lyase family protein [Asticcacaulis sp. SL142]
MKRYFKFGLKYGLLSGLIGVMLMGPAHSAELARCDGVEGYATQGARTFLWRPEWLAIAKTQITTSPEQAKALKSAADKALGRGPYSVTDKPRAPTGGSPHDYASIGPYWWPDPAKPDGLPYVRRDGEVNPERATASFDMTRSQALRDDVQTLSLAYSLLGDEAYARHAANLLRVWFLDPKTRMNPNLTFAQAVPGQSDGRGEGIIDALRFQPIVESIGLIAPSGALTADELRGLEQWFGALANWMRDSDNCRDARARSNNHGIYYDMMLAHFSLFARQEPQAKTVLSAFAETRLKAQMAADGSFPQEMSRTRSWHYSVWALDGALSAAQLAQCVDVDLWRASADGRNLKTGVDYLTPYLTGARTWPKADLDLNDPKRKAREQVAAKRTLRRAAWGFGDAQLSQAIENRTLPSNLEDDLLLPAFPVTTQK